MPWANVYSEVIASSVGRSYAYAGFWIRFVAYLVDSLLIGIPTLIVAFVLLSGNQPLSQDPAQLQAQLQTNGSVIQLVSLVTGFVYFVFFWTQGSTPGMRLVNIRVADQTTFQSIGAGKAVLRYFGWVVSSFCCLIGFIWAAFDSRKQGWHDKMGGTVVIYR